MASKKDDVKVVEASKKFNTEEIREWNKKAVSSHKPRPNQDQEHLTESRSDRNNRHKIDQKELIANVVSLDKYKTSKRLRKQRSGIEKQSVVNQVNDEYKARMADGKQNGLKVNEIKKENERREKAFRFMKDYEKGQKKRKKLLKKEIGE